MITHYIKEHDGDCYPVHYVEAHEFQCVCDRIVSKEHGCQCEVCQKEYCSRCGCSNYKNTGWFVCQDCQENPERIIDAPLSTLS